MQRDFRTFLWDMRDAADAIQGYVQGRSFDDYLANRLLRADVEREFVWAPHQAMHFGKLW